MNKKAILGLFGGVVVALSASIAQATIITFDYVATGNGGTVTGTFGYNGTVSDTNSDASFGTFPAAGFLTGTVTSGPQNGIFFQNRSATVGTNDDAGSTPYRDYFGVNFRVMESYFTFIEFVNFSDTKPVSPLTTDQIASPLLPGTLTNLANWDIGRVVVYASSQELEYTLESVSRVPEPTTLASMTLGLAGLGFARKKKQIKSERKLQHLTNRALVRVLIFNEWELLAGSRGPQISPKAVAGKTGVRRTAAMRGPSLPAALGHKRS